MLRACPAHLEPVNDELVCDYCVYPLRAWVVLDDRRRIVGAGRLARDSDEGGGDVWLSDDIDPKAILNELVRHARNPKEEERLLLELPWGGQ